LAARTHSERMVQALEGGYDKRFVGKIASLAIAEMSRSEYTLHDRAPAESSQVRTLGEWTIEATKKVQRKFWNLK